MANTKSKPRPKKTTTKELTKKQDTKRSAPSDDELVLLEESAGMRIFEWSCSVPSKVAALSELEGVPREWRDLIRYGLPLPAPWPAGAYFAMRPERPKDTKLADMHSTWGDLVVIGPRLAPIVREIVDEQLVLYPVAVHDHQGKVASSEYHLVHTTRTLDCIDVEASGAERHISPSRLDPEELWRWNHLTLRAGDLPIPKVFRIKHVPGKIFVREDLAMKIEALGLSKPYFTELADV